MMLPPGRLPSVNVDAAVNISKETWYDSELITSLPASRKVRWRSRSLLWPSRRKRCCAPERACLSDSAPSAVLRSPSRITVPWRSRKGCSEAGEWDSGGRDDCEKLRKKVLRQRQRSASSRLSCMLAARSRADRQDFRHQGAKEKTSGRCGVGGGGWRTPRHKPYVLLQYASWRTFTPSPPCAPRPRSPAFGAIPRPETILTRHSPSTSALK